MANRTIHSDQITFLDYTDDRKLYAYITSNLPTSQIYNINDNSYSPNWSTTNLRLSADIFLDSEDVTTNAQTSIKWFSKIGTDAEVELGSGVQLAISDNAMSDSINMITYICKATYQGITTTAQITFARVDTGPKGDGAANIILNADAQVFRVDNNGIVFPDKILVSAQEINTTITEWSYSVNGGETFRSTAPIGVARVNNKVTISGETMTADTLIIKASDGTYSDTYTVYKVFDGEQGEQGEGAPIAFLTNENIAFSADAQGQVSGATFTTNIVAYEGSIKVEPDMDAITGLPEGITSVSEVIDDELVITFTIEDGATLGSALSNSGTINIPITYPVNTSLTLSWSKINTGATGANGEDAVTFQVYSADGHVLSQDTPSIMLQTFAYIGDTPIEAGATYQWYYKNDEEWTALTEEVEEGTTAVPVTTSYANINHSNISFSCSYMCKMTFNGIEYVDVVTIDDKNDSNIVFTSKPSAYSEGDIWIVGSDYIPEGVEVGTVLKAQYPNTTYADTDWVTATKYDDKISNIENDVNNYKQYISLDTTYGIKMNAIDEDGNVSEFSTTLSNTQLSFNQADEPVAYINNHKMHITEAEIESPLTVTGKYSDGGSMLQMPTINLGNFSFVVESNGSLSIVSNL